MQINPESIAKSRPKKTRPNHVRSIKNRAQNASNIHAKSHHILQRPPGASQNCLLGVPGVFRVHQGGPAWKQLWWESVLVSIRCDFWHIGFGIFCRSIGYGMGIAIVFQKLRGEIGSYIVIHLMHQVFQYFVIYMVEQAD